MKGKIKRLKKSPDLAKDQAAKAKVAKHAKFVLGPSDPRAKKAVLEYRRAKAKREKSESGKANSDKKRYRNQK
jgi:hypothetical protein